MNTENKVPKLVLEPKRTLTVFGGAGIALLALGLLSQYLRVFPNSYNIRYPYQADLLHDFILEFNFNGQPNIVIYYKILLLQMAACLLLIIAYLKSRASDRYHTYWWMMACIVLFFSIDNLALVGKKVLILVQYNPAVNEWPEYSWTVIWLVLLTILFYRFWVHLQHPSKFLFLAPAVLYLTGVAVQDVSWTDPNTFIYSIYLTISQALQYGGAILAIYSLSFFITVYYREFFVSTKN